MDETYRIFWAQSTHQEKPNVQHFDLKRDILTIDGVVHRQIFQIFFWSLNLETKSPRFSDQGEAILPKLAVAASLNLAAGS